MTTQATESIHPGTRPLREAYGELVWRRSSIFGRGLKLESGSDTLAVLNRWGPWSRNATAESADGRWTFAYSFVGFTRRRIEVREASTGAVVATYLRDWPRKGGVRFTTGAEFVWDHEGFWRPEYFWSSPGHARLVSYRVSLGFRTRFEMEIDPGARSVAELPVLALLGGYLMARLITRRHAH
jgi:hypothetical protein